MPNVLLFGGSGKIGQGIATRMANGDTHVYIVTRSPEAYKGVTNDNVTVITLDIFDSGAIQKCLWLHQIGVVMSALAFPPTGSPQDCDGYLRNIRATVQAMKQTSCKRLVVISCWYASRESRTFSVMGCSVYFVMNFVPVLSKILDKVHDGHLWMDEYLLSKEAEGIDWTSCRAGILELGSAPQNKQGFETAIGMDYVPRVNFWKGGGSHNDAARFMVEAVDNKEWFGKIVTFGREKSSGCFVWRPK